MALRLLANDISRYIAILAAPDNGVAGRTDLVIHAESARPFVLLRIGLRVSDRGYMMSLRWLTCLKRSFLQRKAFALRSYHQVTQGT